MPHDADHSAQPDAPHKADRIAELRQGAQPARVRRMMRRLGFGAALIAVAVALLLAAAGYRAHHQAEAEVLAETEEMVADIAGHTARFIEAGDLMLDRLRQLGEDTDWGDPTQPARLPTELRRLRGLIPAIVRLGIWNQEGRNLASTEDDPPSNITVADRPYFAVHASRTGGRDSLAISEPLTSQVDGTTILVLSRRMNHPDGAFAGVVTLSFNPAELRQRPLGPSTGPRAAVRWLRDDQRPLAAEPALQKPPADSAPPAQPSAQTVRRQVGAYPLLVETTIPDQAVYQHWLAVILPYLALGLVVLFGFGAGAWVLLRWASTEDSYRSTLATLASRLRQSNADLEQRVDERTLALTEAVTQRDLLLKEVNHRLKNSLQLACALVQMQGQTVGTPEVRQQLADTVARLQAIARVHDQLYQTNDIRRVEAAVYLRSLCADLEQSTLANQRFWRIVVEADPVDLPTDQAVPVGLMVNELVTNAMKHGQPTAPGDGAWMVEVGLAQLGDGRVRLTVRDHGPGLPDDTLPRNPGSLGMKLLSGLTRQLSATLTIENAAPGARFVVVFLPQDVA